MALTGFFRGNAVGRDESEAPHVLRFQRAHSRAGELAQIGGRKRLGFSATEKQQPLGFQLRGGMQKRGFENLAGCFAARDHVFGCVFDGCVVRVDENVGLIFLASVEHDGDQAIGFDFGGSGKGKNGLHRLSF